MILFLLKQRNKENICIYYTKPTITTTLRTRYVFIYIKPEIFISFYASYNVVSAVSMVFDDGIEERSTALIG